MRILLWTKGLPAVLMIDRTDPHLYVCKEDGEPSLRMWALSCLIEDAQNPLPSYNQYLSTVRERVRLSQPRSRPLSVDVVRQVNGVSG